MEIRIVLFVLFEHNVSNNSNKIDEITNNVIFDRGWNDTIKAEISYTPMLSINR